MPIKGLKGGIGTKALGYGLGAVEEATDAEFNQTVLLLHGDGSEGEGDTAALGDPNYKAFRDNSTSNHAITVQGDAYGNDFSPYYYADGYWSNSFDGNGDNLITPSNAAFGFGTGDFTIEFWTYVVSTSNTPYFLDGRSTSTANEAVPALYINSGNYEYYVNAAARINGGAVPLNQWVHVAVVRSSGTTTLYSNGVSVGTWSDSTNYATTALVIGQRKDTAGQSLTGNISNFRVVKGTAVYTSAFTPSTTPLTAISGTSLLTCQSNRFVDNSSNAFALTVNGTPKVSTNTPFTVTKTANVGSGFFQRTTDYLTSSNTATNFGTNDFTMECWVYYTALPPSNSAHAYIYGMNSGSHEVLWYLYYNSLSGQYQYTFRDPDVSSLVRTLITPTTHEWIHLAVVRSGTTITLFQNGQALTPSQVGDAGSHSYTCDEISVGGTSSLNGSFDGYIADVRVINGTALYTSNFTPPTSSLTAVTNTTFLTCQYSGAVRNVGFLDDSKYNHQITRNGDVSMGTFSPFSAEDGYWSNFFDGSGDYLTIPDDASLDLGTGAFTIEAWIYPTWSSPGSNEPIVAKGNSAATGTWQLSVQNTSVVRFAYNTTGTSFSSTGTISPNQWTHIAVVREGTGTDETKIYINGVNDGTGTVSQDLTDTGLLKISQNRENTTIFDGYISNVRIVKGTALYTSTFTPPTTALTAITNTELLTCQSNRFVDNSTNGHTITVNGNPKVQPFSPFAPSRSYSKDAVGGSAYFDGSGDYLTIPDSADFTLGSNNFTIECWVYATDNVSSEQSLISQWGTPNAFQLEIKSGQVKCDIETSGIYTLQGGTFLLNSWNHVAMSRTSSTFSLFLNGSRVATTTVSGSVKDSNDGIGIGVRGGGTSYTFDGGYIADARIVNGSSIYDATQTSYTVPTAPLTSTGSETKLLTNFTNAGIIDHTMKNNLETEGNVRISGQQTKFGTGSMYFDGTGDAINIPMQSYLAFGSGDVTVEAFVYPNSVSGQHSIFDTRVSGSFGADAFLFRIDGGTVEVWAGSYSGVSVVIGGGTISTGTWTHIAFTRENGTNRLFVNGTQPVSSNTNSWNQTFTSTNLLTIGNTIGLSRYFDGYIDDMRVTKGVARYTSDFTAPTKAFANR